MTYEYLCTECAHTWEEEQSISAAPTETCPSCGHKSAKRQVSGGVGFILKGGGWYADGYGSGSSKKSPESPADKSGSSGSAGSGAKKSDTPSDSKSGDTKGDTKGDSGKGGGASGDSAASPPA